MNLHQCRIAVKFLDSCCQVSTVPDSFTLTLTTPQPIRQRKPVSIQRAVNQTEPLLQPAQPTPTHSPSMLCALCLFLFTLPPIFRQEALSCSDTHQPLLRPHTHSTQTGMGNEGERVINATKEADQASEQLKQQLMDGGMDRWVKMVGVNRWRDELTGSMDEQMDGTLGGGVDEWTMSLDVYRQELLFTVLVFIFYFMKNKISFFR